MKRITVLLLALTALVSCMREQPIEVGGPVNFKCTRERISFNSDGGSILFTIEADGRWKATTDASWLTLSEYEGAKTAAITASATANSSDQRRETKIVFTSASGEGTPFELPVIQYGVGEVIPVDPSEDESEDPLEPEEPGRVIERSEFTLDTEWGITGTLMGHDWGLTPEDVDTPMLGEPSGWVAAFDIVIEAGDQFKFRMNNDWDNNYGTSGPQPKIDRKYPLGEGGMDNNFQLAAGTYDIYVHPTFMIMYVENAGDVFAHGDAKGDQEEGENIRIYILNNSTWNTPYLYAYAGGGGYQPFGSWPGKYASGTKTFGDYLYTYWEASGFADVSGVSLIINDGDSHQYPAAEETEKLWSNLTINTSLYFTFDGTTVTAVEDPAAPGVTGKGLEPKEMKFGTSSWTVIGTFDGSNWDYDFPMDTEGYWDVAREIPIAAGEQFKFRQNRQWTVNLGYGDYSDTGASTVSLDTKLDLVKGAGNMTVASSGKFDIYLCAEKSIAYILTSGSTWTHEAEGKPEVNFSGDYNPDAFVTTPSSKHSGITYQINVFSFKDSNNDGYGDLHGITQSLDYFDRLGVTGLWLSPVQPAQSYHGYDVTDYEKINPRFGTEEDFANLIKEAHKHNIRIYMDYVINHSGDQNKWFLDVKKNGPSSEYWNYYSLSKNPEADSKSGKFPQTCGWYDSAKWYPVLIGAGGKERIKIELDWTNASAPTMKVTKTTEEVTSASAPHNNPARYLFWGNSTYTQFADNGTNKYVLVLDFESSWGCLIRTTTDKDDWAEGTKWGLNKSGDQLKYGEAHVLYKGASDDVQNIVMPGGDMYYYYTEFRTGMFVDFDYGPSTSVASSPAFKAVVGSAKKWLQMGVDGFRLDAVKHIYANETGPENKDFWKAFYNACNETYKANASKRTGLAWQDENIFMVGEVLSGDGDCTPFYECLPALFEFQFWWDLRECLGGETIWNAGYGQTFPSSLSYRWGNHRAQRADAIATPKLANHDEDRTASTLGNYKPKIRLAAAVLLTSAGRPYIYQGEELGYWGTKAGGDEYVRTPIMWTKQQSSAASKGVSNKVDWNMLTPAISVEGQTEDETSLLTLYRRFAYARNINAALADGYPTVDDLTKDGYGGHIAGWYLHSQDGTKDVLVLHNLSGYTENVSRTYSAELSDNLSNILIANGKVTVSGSTVTMPPYSSVVFALN